MCVCACVRACVRACVQAGGRVSVSVCACARMCVSKEILHFTNDKFVYVNIVCFDDRNWDGKRVLYFCHLPIVFLFVKDSFCVKVLCMFSEVSFFDKRRV